MRRAPLLKRARTRPRRSGGRAHEPAQPADAALLERDRAHAELRGERLALARLELRAPGERLHRATEHESHGAREEAHAVIGGDEFGERFAEHLVARRLEELKR